MSEPRERETAAEPMAEADVRMLLRVFATDKVSEAIAEQTVDVIYNNPYTYPWCLKLVGIEYRDGQFYESRRSPQGGRKEGE